MLHSTNLSLSWQHCSVECLVCHLSGPDHTPFQTSRFAAASGCATLCLTHCHHRCITGLRHRPTDSSAVAVFVNELTKHMYTVPCSDNSDAVDWASIYVEGLAVVIVSNRSSQRNSAFCKVSAPCLGAEWDQRVHPQTDRQTERANRIIEDVLRTLPLLA